MPTGRLPPFREVPLGTTTLICGECEWTLDLAEVEDDDSEIVQCPACQLVARVHPSTKAGTVIDFDCDEQALR